ncbi:MAG: hypothetical protein AB1746_01695 [Candidatus Zixiibacteriota bacterium]
MDIVKYSRIKMLLFVLSLLISLQVQGADINDNNVALLGQVKSTNSLEISQLNTHRLVGDKLITVADQGDTRVFTVFDAGSMKELWWTAFPFTFFYVSDGDRPAVVLTQVLNEAEFNIKAFDLGGELLFSKEHYGEGEIHPSPNGDYFYTCYSQLSRNILEVFSRRGDLLFSFPRIGYQWDAASFNDNVLSYYIFDTVKFIDANTGSEIKSVHVPVAGTERVDMYPITPTRWLAKNGSRMILSWHGKVIYFGPDMDIVWEARSPYLFLNAAFSADNQYVAIYRKIEKQCRLDLVRSLDGGTLWREETRSNVMEGTSDHPSVVFSGEYIQVLSPQTNYLVSGALNDNTRTFLFNYDKASGDLKSKSAFEGAVLIYDSFSGATTYSVSANQKHSILVREWTNAENHNK